MTDPVESAPGDLPLPECLRLLRGESVGRVVYTAGAIPVATPVNYVVDGDAVVFRTRPGSRLAKGTSGAVVSFEVDRVDEATASGWSVLVTGVSEVVGLGGSAARPTAAVGELGRRRPGPYGPPAHIAGVRQPRRRR